MSTVTRPVPQASELTGAATRSPRDHVIDVAWFFSLSLAIAATATVARVPPALLPFLLVAAPTVLAILLAWREGGGALRRLLRLLALRPKRGRWFLAVGLPVAWALGTVAIAVTLGTQAAGVFDKVMPAILIIPLVVVIPALAEELAWRGYALPRLMTAMSPLKATLLLAVPWTLIHVPLFLSGQMNAELLLWPLPLSIAAYSVILGFIFVGSGGSVLLTGLVHGALNGVSPLMTGVEPNTQWVIRNVIAAAVALGIVAFGGLKGGQRLADRLLARANTSEA